MRKVWAWGGAAAIAVMAACATSTAPSGNEGNGGDAGNIPLYDAGSGGGSDSGSSTTCTLGSADHCGSCSTVCPGPADADGGTERICSDSTTTATCDIICKGEFYDLNGDINDGCEAEDPIVHDNADAAVPQSATSSGFNVPAPYWYLYGDARQHDAPPIARTLGREDWYVISHPDGALNVCLSITNFPSDDSFEVCATNVNNKNIPTTGTPCKTVTPTTVSPNNCVTPEDGGNQTGVYYVRVRKLDGSNTANGYALFLKD